VRRRVEGWWQRIARRFREDAVVRRLTIVVVGGFLAGYLFTALDFIAGGPRADVVTVPDVRKLPLARARRQLERSDLLATVGDSLPNPRVARGEVLAQSPLPGQESAPGTEVRLILSQGREKRAVPAVEGYARSQAERILTSSGFHVVVVQTPNPRAAGRVVGTSPAAGTTMEMPGVVRLVLSAGPPLVPVPTVVGMAEAQARAVLEAAGLGAGDATYELRPDLAEGIVLAQDPVGGDSLRAGWSVRLHLSTQQARPEPAAEGVEPPAAPPTLPEPSGVR
jgi:beta-lactam-binding protein with PASTA domain